MAKTTVMIMVDGFDPAYWGICPTPNLQELVRRGFMVEARALMPTVTNVNNVSLVTASYPERHGITSNYWLDRAQGIERYMESGEFIQAETLFQRAARQGLRSLLVASKDKLRRLLGKGATLSLSSEEAPPWVVDLAGPPPPVYSLEVNGWIVDAARRILEREGYDLVYLATTDYAMHTYAPEQPEAARHLALLDAAIGRLLDTLPDCQLLLTADHGMNAKGRVIHLPEILARRGVKAQAVPIIKDKYTVHHSNLGGCIYIHLEDPRQREEALGVLREMEGVEAALSRSEAAQRFRLMPERIGDIMALGAPDVVFGDPAEVSLPPNLRSHGSLHEGRVPIIGYGGDFGGFSFHENRDIGRFVFERVLVSEAD